MNWICKTGGNCATVRTDFKTTQRTTPFLFPSSSFSSLPTSSYTHTHTPACVRMPKGGTRRDADWCVATPYACLWVVAVPFNIILPSPYNPKNIMMPPSSPAHTQQDASLFCCIGNHDERTPVWP